MGMRQPDIFILEETIFGVNLIWVVLLIVDGFTSFSVHGSTCISTLYAKAWNNSMNSGVFIILLGAFLSCAKNTEVFTCVRQIFLE